MVAGRLRHACFERYRWNELNLNERTAGNMKEGPQFRRSIRQTRLLTRVFNMRHARDCPHPDNPATQVHVFEMGAGGPHAELHVAVQPDLPVAQQGAGGVHHVAFRTPDADYDAWADRLNEFQVPNSGKVDRYWFRSLYVREPNGVLFEIATDGPGFAVTRSRPR